MVESRFTYHPLHVALDSCFHQRQIQGFCPATVILSTNGRQREFDPITSSSVFPLLSFNLLEIIQLLISLIQASIFDIVTISLIGLK